MISLTRHFKERWVERVGEHVPDETELQRIIASGVELQKHRDVFTPTGRPITILSMYFIPGRDVVIKVDGKRRRAVTVLTPKCLED